MHLLSKHAVDARQKVFCNIDLIIIALGVRFDVYFSC